MNLKEEILAYADQEGQFTFTAQRSSPPIPMVIKIEDAERIAESYAKERAWEAFKEARNFWYPFNITISMEENYMRQKPEFEIWWGENK